MLSTRNYHNIVNWLNTNTQYKAEKRKQMGEEHHLLNAFLPGATPLSLSFFHCILKFFISLALLCGVLDLVP